MMKVEVPAAEHPRVMVRSWDVDRIIENLDKPENKLAYDIWRELCETEITGTGATPDKGSYHLKEYLAGGCRIND